MIEAYFSQIEAILCEFPTIRSYTLKKDVLLEIAQRERTYKADKLPKY